MKINNKIRKYGGDLLLHEPLFYYPLGLLRKCKDGRAFHAFCIAPPKSGTHSIIGMLEKNYKAKHEPTSTLLIKLLLEGNTNEKLSFIKIKKVFRARDYILHLEMESSHLLVKFFDIIVKIFDKAKFVILVRDGRSWLDSIINSQLNDRRLGTAKNWEKIYKKYFGNGTLEYSKEEKILHQKDLYPISSYLSYWKLFYEKVSRYRQDKRFMIIKTNQLRFNISNLSQFLNIDSNTIDKNRNHQFKTPKKHHILEKIDSIYLERKINEFCHEINEKLFLED